MGVSSRRFSRLLGGLDPESVVEFVSDLWAARGWEATVDGRRIRATRARPDEALTLLVLPRRREAWRRRADGDVDVVVDARATWVGRRFADACGARYLDADDLFEMVRYGLDPRAADRLLRAHLGRSLAAVGGDRSSSDRPPILVGAVLLAVLVSGAAAASLYLDGGEDATAAPSATTSDSAYPPGVDDAGLVSAERLADAHRDAIDGRSYRWVVVSRRTSVGGERIDGALRRTVVVENETAFRRVVEGNRTSFERGTATFDSGVYADGEHVYWRITRSDGPVYSRVAVDDIAAGTELFTNQAEEYLLRYLSTDRTDVVDDERTGAYRLIARGTPSHLTRNVSEYTAVATVGREGFVSYLRVSYVVEDENVAHRIEFTFRYTEIGSAEASPPEWYGDALAATAPSGSTTAPATRTSAQTVRSTNETTSSSSSREIP